MNASDPERRREASLAMWEGAAPGWARWQQHMREFTLPVSRWLVDALRLKDGCAVLDIAAGIGETGLIAAQRVLPHGNVILADQAEAMVNAAKQRADELQLDHVQARQLNAESLDLQTASLDGVLCRWGLMLLVDPSAALGEWRRVLRSGGRLSLAVWDEAGRNPWASLLAQVLMERGVTDAPQQGSDDSPRADEHEPGMFALADEGRLRELIEDAGFTEVRVDSLPLVRRHQSFAELWECTLDMSPGAHDAVMSLPPAEIPLIAAAVADAFAPFTAEDGSLAIPACTLLASAEA